MKVKNLEHALEVFELNALKQDECTFEDGSARKFNKYSDQIADIARWLYKNNSLLQLSCFYTHKNFNVRSWAARLLLEIDAINAEKILEDLVAMKYTDAEYVLMEWRAGTLDMDFFKK